jgi:hypothetical protein
MKSTKAMGWAVCLAYVVAVTAPAHAGQVTNAKIFSLSVGSGGTTAKVVLTGGTTSVPMDACGPGTNFAFIVTTNEGKALLSLLISAFLAGKTVGLTGSTGDNCTTFNGGNGAPTTSETLFSAALQ